MADIEGRYVRVSFDGADSSRITDGLIPRLLCTSCLVLLSVLVGLAAPRRAVARPQVLLGAHVFNPLDRVARPGLRWSSRRAARRFRGEASNEPERTPPENAPAPRSRWDQVARRFGDLSRLIPWPRRFYSLYDYRYIEPVFVNNSGRVTWAVMKSQWMYSPEINPLRVDWKVLNGGSSRSTFNATTGVWEGTVNNGFASIRAVLQYPLDIRLLNLNDTSPLQMGKGGIRMRVAGPFPGQPIYFLMRDGLGNEGAVTIDTSPLQWFLPDTRGIFLPEWEWAQLPVDWYRDVGLDDFGDLRFSWITEWEFRYSATDPKGGPNPDFKPGDFKFKIKEMEAFGLSLAMNNNMFISDEGNNDGLFADGDFD